MSFIIPNQIIRNYDNRYFISNSSSRSTENITDQYNPVKSFTASQQLNALKSDISSSSTINRAKYNALYIGSGKYNENLYIPIKLSKYATTNTTVGTPNINYFNLDIYGDGDVILGDKLGFSRLIEINLDVDNTSDIPDTYVININLNNLNIISRITPIELFSVVEYLSGSGSAESKRLIINLNINNCNFEGVNIRNVYYDTTTSTYTTTTTNVTTAFQNANIHYSTFYKNNAQVENLINLTDDAGTQSITSPININSIKNCTFKDYTFYPNCRIASVLNNNFVDCVNNGVALSNTTYDIQLYGYNNYSFDVADDFLNYPFTYTDIIKKAVMDGLTDTNTYLNLYTDALFSKDFTKTSLHDIEITDSLNLIVAIPTLTVSKLEVELYKSISLSGTNNKAILIPYYIYDGSNNIIDGFVPYYAGNYSLDCLDEYEFNIDSTDIPDNSLVKLYATGNATPNSYNFVASYTITIKLSTALNIVGQRTYKYISSINVVNTVTAVEPTAYLVNTTGVDVIEQPKIAILTDTSDIITKFLVVDGGVIKDYNISNITINATSVLSYIDTIFHTDLNLKITEDSPLYQESFDSNHIGSYDKRYDIPMKKIGSANDIQTNQTYNTPTSTTIETVKSNNVELGKKGFLLNLDTSNNKGTLTSNIIDFGKIVKVGKINSDFNSIDLILSGFYSGQNSVNRPYYYLKFSNDITTLSNAQSVKLEQNQIPRYRVSGATFVGNADPQFFTTDPNQTIKNVYARYIQIIIDQRNPSTSAPTTTVIDGTQSGGGNQSV